MKKTIILSIVFCAFFAYMPFAAQADDLLISELSVEHSSLEASADNSIDVTFTNTGVTIPVNESIYFLFSDDDYNSADFGCDDDALTTSDFSAIQSCDDETFVITIQNDALTAGEHSFNLEVTNPSQVDFYQLEVTTASGEGHGDFENTTVSEEFRITSAETNAVTAFSYETSNDYAGMSNDFDIAITLDSLDAGESFQILLVENTESGSPQNSGFDFSEATVTHDTISCESPEDTEYALSCASETELNGAYTFTISGVINSDTPGEYQVFATSVQDISSAEDVVIAQTNLTLAELPAPGKIKKKKNLKVKNKKKRQAKLWWKAKDGATKYQMTLSKKKVNKKNKYKLVKKFKGITNNYKLVKKSKEFLKSKKDYRFRVRCGNETGWSKWSPWKKFTMK